MPIKSGLSAQLGMADELYVNEVQQIAGTPSATFGLNFDGALTTVSLTTTATAASVQTALNLLPNIGAAGVACAGGPLPGTPITVTFSGALVSGRNVPLLAVQGAVTGLTFTTPTPGTGYGDAQTVTRFLEFTQESLALTVERIESSAIRTSNLLLRTDRWTSNRKGAAGDVTFEVANTGFGLLFKHMAGGNSTITTPASGVNTRDHTYNLLTDPTSKSLTMQVGRTDQTGTTQPFTYKGCKLDTWELTQDLDGILMLKTTIDAMDEDSTVGLAAASFPASQTLMNFTSGQITIGGANFDCTKLTLAMNRAINTTRYFIRNNTLKKEPVSNDLIAFTGEIDAEFSDMTAYNRFVNGTLAAVTMTWTGALIETVAGPISYFYQVIVTLPQVRFDGGTPNVQNPDVIPINMPIKVLWDGTVQPSIVYRTTDVAD